MKEKHSGICIAPFITSIVVRIITFLVIVVAGVMEASTPGGRDEKAAGTIVLGLFIE